MNNMPEDRLLKAATGLEGGCVASGSTCGVLTGGAIGLALNNEAEIINGGIAAELKIHSRIKNYVDWFENTYGTSLCRKRSKSDFHKPSGLLRYLLPGDRIVRCMWHIRGAMRYLYDIRHAHIDSETETDMVSDENSFHCAKAVLSGIREKTDIGDLRLERLAFVFDGGLGLCGGICGAFAGAVMAVNLLLGLNVRRISYWKIIKAFTIGHMNLLLEKPVGPPEPFMAGSEIAVNFKKAAGALECRDITGRQFSGWDDFQIYISESVTCAELIDETIGKTSEIILRYK
jgi:C_GCAxxG_C_C family probable redox protein